MTKNGDKDTTTAHDAAIASPSSSGTLGSSMLNSPEAASSVSSSNNNINKYDHYSDAQLEEFAKVASPKVSELLKEQALVLDDLLDSTPWSSDSSNSSVDSDDYDRDIPPPSFSSRDFNDDYGDGYDDAGKQRGQKKKGGRGNYKGRYSTKSNKDDSMDEEWDQLEAAQLDLKDELDAATNGFAQMLYGNEDNNAADYDELDCYNISTAQWSSSREHGEIANCVDGEEKLAESKDDNNNEEEDEWRDSIHQYYADNNPSPSMNNSKNAFSPNMSNNNNNNHSMNKYRSPSSPNNTSSFNPKPNHSYTLADHARTLSLSRPDHTTTTNNSSNHRSSTSLYIKPYLSRHEIETSHIIKLPTWITRPSGEVSSRGRERYMKRILDCTVEYVEPVKSKNLRRLFSGWTPSVGERRLVEDESMGGERMVRGGGGVGDNDVTNEEGGSSSQRVMAYAPPDKRQHANAIVNDSVDDDGDSSADEEDVDHFEDVEGMAYNTTSRGTRRPMEPLPVRTVTVRIRPDVLCGAVMDALTTSVEGCGGEMTKRQGGHLRAILPGRKMRVWMTGERQRKNETIATNNVNHRGEDVTPQRGESNNHNDNTTPTSLQNHDNPDDTSLASGISSMLSLSPMLTRSTSTRIKGPTYDILPPTIVDAQLVTKKVGKECQRLVLIRIYRVQDVARASMMMGGERETIDEEVYDVIAPLESTEEDGMVGGSSMEEGVNGGGVDNDEHGNGMVGGKSAAAAVDPLLESKRSLKALQEASALVQRIKAVGGSGFAIDPPQQLVDDATVTSQTSTKSYLKSFGDAITSPMRYLVGSSNGSSGVGGGGASSQTKTPTNAHYSPYPTVMELMSRELLRKHIPSPSVGTTSKSAMVAAKQRSNGLFPALSKEDVPYVKSSWIFLRDCVEELDRRRLAYSTLGICPLFQFPALPTLDVHFISQIKAFCRESMIVSLVKTASELEIYAREFEVSCGNVEQLLRPTFEMYKLRPPQLPMPVPLTAYPLDFRAPEEISPPWGSDVMAALEKISNDLVIHPNNNDRGNNDQTKQNPLSSFERSEMAISLLVSAFQRQNDVEQGARLGRKNMQVMDRLAKMQAHKRNSIAKIRASYGTNLLATKAADEFHSRRKRSSNVGSLSDVIRADRSEEVPLLTCNVLVGNAAGTCYVTHSHILFNTQLVPILGGSKIHLFSILAVQVTINAPSKSVLSPLPASISLTTAVFGGSGRKTNTREEVYNFIPSIGARRFAKFLEVLRDVALEDPNSLKFSEKGGLIYLPD